MIYIALFIIHRNKQENNSVSKLINYEITLISDESSSTEDSCKYSIQISSKLIQFSFYNSVATFVNYERNSIQLIMAPHCHYSIQVMSMLN